MIPRYSIVSRSIYQSDCRSMKHASPIQNHHFNVTVAGKSVQPSCKPWSNLAGSKAYRKHVQF